MRHGQRSRKSAKSLFRGRKRERGRGSAAAERAAAALLFPIQSSHSFSLSLSNRYKKPSAMVCLVSVIRKADLKDYIFMEKHQRAGGRARRESEKREKIEMASKRRERNEAKASKNPASQQPRAFSRIVQEP